MLQEGIIARKSITVTQDLTAAAMGSGTLDVYATPALVALMENTAMLSVSALLGTGEVTVGSSIHVEHTAASPVGITVSCGSTLTAVEGRKLTFALEAFDTKGPIGKATHVRYIVDAERFVAKANQKLD